MKKNILEYSITKALIIALILTTINWQIVTATSVTVYEALYEIDTNKDGKYNISEIQTYIASLGGVKQLLLIGGYQFAGVIVAIKSALGLS